MFPHKGVFKVHGLGKDDCCCIPEFRHFISKKEKKEMLKEYRDQLKKEIEGLEETIQELESK